MLYRIFFVKIVNKLVNYLLFCHQIEDTNNDELSYLRIKQSMENLITKSSNSKIAADLLADEKLYCNCIQCYYYSMLQLSKAVLIKEEYHCINVLDDEVLDGRVVGKGSHVRIIKGVMSVMEKLKGSMRKWEYGNAMDAAKRIRVHAAYTSKLQTADDVASIKGHYQLCNKLLEDTLKI